MQAPESKIPWNLVGLGLGIGAAVLLVVSQSILVQHSLQADHLTIVC